MSPNNDDLVTKGTCLDLLNWLEKNADDGILTEPEFAIFRSIAADDNKLPGSIHPYSLFLNYCQKHNLDFAKWKKSYLRKKCSNLSTHILEPASKKMGLKKHVYVTLKKEESGDFYFQLVYKNNYQLNKMLANLDDTRFSNSEWTRIVFEAVKNGYTLEPCDCAISTRAIDVDKNEKRSLKDTVPLKGAHSNHQNSSENNKGYSFIPRKAIKIEKWELTRLECVFKLPQNLDDEQFNQILEPYQKACRHAIRDYDGTLEYDLDNKISVYFGGPDGVDLHARYAVKSALQMLQHFELIRDRHLKSDFPTPEIHILLHSFDTTIPISNHNIHSPNAGTIIQQLESLNLDNKVIISPSTHSFVCNFFDCRPIKRSSKTNSKEPIAYQVISDLNIPTIFDSKYAEEFPLIGRNKELNLIRKSWNKVQKGDPRLVWVYGMHGIGKSRLIHEFIRELKDNKPRILTCQCLSNYTNTPFYPIVQMLRDHLDIKHEKKTTKQSHRLRFFAKQFGLDINKILPVITALMENPYDTIKHSDSNPRENSYQLLEETAHKENLPDILLEIVQAIAIEPVIILFKDLQWADSSTKELFTKLLEKVIKTETSQHILVIASYRDPKPVNVKGISEIEVQLPLQPLDDNDSGELAEIIASKKNTNLNTNEIESIVRNSRGIPQSLYAAIVDGDISDSWFKKIMFDLDHISRSDDIITHKDIAQMASLLGTTFNYDCLKNTLYYCMELPSKAHKSNYDTLFKANFDDLLKRELFHPRPLATQDNYEFACEDIRRQVYNSISSQDKKELHIKIAELFEREISAKVTEISAEIISQHYTSALEYAIDNHSRNDIGLKATHWWHQTAKTAIYKLSLPEAIYSLNQAKCMLNNLLESPTKLKIELQIHLDLATCYELLHGPADIKVLEAFQKAKDVSQIDGGVTSIFRTQWSDWFYTYLKGDLGQAQLMARNLLSTPACEESCICHLEAQHAMWDTLFHRGDMQSAWIHHFQGLHFSEYLSINDHKHGYAGHSAKVCCMSRSALLMWFYGYLDQSLILSKKAVQFAEALQHANTIAHAHCHAAILHVLRKEPDKIETFAINSINSAKEYSIKPRLILGRLLLNAAKLQNQTSTDLLLSFDKNRMDWKSIGARMFETLWLTISAEACLKSHKYKDGLNYIKNAISVSQETEERFYLPEIYRIKAELLTKSKCSEDEIKKQFFLAKELAEKQNAKTLKLRILVSLCNSLSNKRGRSKETTRVKAELQHLYDSFNEGHNTPDLTAAKKIIET